MTLVKNGSEWESIQPFLRVQHPLCFLCDDELHGYPLVLWHGAEKDLLLHTRCAIRLGNHLISDAMQDKKARPQ